MHSGHCFHFHRRLLLRRQQSGSHGRRRATFDAIGPKVSLVWLLIPASDYQLDDDLEQTKASYLSNADASDLVSPYASLLLERPDSASPAEFDYLLDDYSEQTAAATPIRHVAGCKSSFRTPGMGVEDLASAHEKPVVSKTLEQLFFTATRYGATITLRKHHGYERTQAPALFEKRGDGRMV